MERKLDVYKISIDPKFSDGKTELGIEKIAFVKNPAILTKGMAFNADTKKQMHFADNVKMRIAAPALIPMNIYRCDDEDGYEYEVQFTEEVSEELYHKFMANLDNKSKPFNLEHQENELSPAYILECIFVDNDAKIKMIKDTYGIDVPMKTIFFVSQITDRKYYDDLVANEQYAYSIEGMLGLDFKAQLSDMKNKNKNKEQKMENNVLPEGAKFQIADKWYEVKDGKVIEVVEETKPVAAEETKPVEEKKEEIKAEDVKEEVKPVEEVKAEETPIEETPKEEVKMAIDEAELMTILQPKFDEIYKMIADLKAEEVTEDVIPSEQPIAMTAIEKRLAFAKSFIK